MTPVPTYEDISAQLIQYREALVTAKQDVIEWDTLESHPIYKKFITKWMDVLTEKGIQAILEPEAKEDAIQALSLVSAYKRHRNSPKQRINELESLIKQHEAYIGQLEEGTDDV